MGLLHATVDAPEGRDVELDTVAPTQPAEWSSSRARAHRLSLAVLIALGVGFALAVVQGAGIDESNAGADGQRLGGDFPAFYGAGSIVNELGFDSLYDPAAQQAAQAGLGVDGYLAFAYAPHVALPYSVLAGLDFQLAYVIHVVAMLSALAAALRLLETPIPALAANRLPAFAAALTFYPLLTAVGGGQNTAITVLLIAATWSYLHRGNEVIAGVAIGLLVFRPQYCLPLLGLCLLSRHWRAAFTATGVVAATWALNALVAGFGWISWWLDAVVPFVETDADVNAPNSISLPGFVHALAGSSTLPTMIGYGLAATVVGVLCWIWARTDVSLELKMAAATAGILLISPHTMFYDAGVLLVAYAALSTAMTRHTTTQVGVALWLGSWIHLGAKTFGFTPLVVLPVGLFAVAVLIAATGKSSSEEVLAHA